MRGGEVINKGSYGCVISPNKPCDKTFSGTSGDYVSKIFYGKKGKEDRDREWEVLQEIAKIDPEFKFTIEPVDNCNIWNIGGGDVGQCTNKILVPQIILRNGGPDLHGFERGLIKPISYKNFLRSFRRLVEGCKKMEEAELVHRDIKPGNILYNEEKNRFYIVDFGLACKTSEVYNKSNEYILQHVYPYYPPEFRILGYIYKLGKSDKEIVEYIGYVVKDRKKFKATDIMYDAVKNMIVPGRMGEVDIMELIDMHADDVSMFLVELMRSIKNKSFAAFAERISKRVDIYSLGVTMYYLYDNDFIEFRDGIQEESLNFIFKGMTNASPIRRWSAEGVLKKLDQMKGRKN